MNNAFEDELAKYIEDASCRILDAYQIAATTTAIFPGRGSVNGLAYCALGLNGEAGEVAEVVKKVLRDDGGSTTTKSRDALELELGDCLWYIANLADQLGLDLSRIARANLQKLARRRAEGKLRGSGSDR
jgi:NTP pyrophosphatase (non-canonical NTP hydrolase)